MAKPNLINLVHQNIRGFASKELEIGLLLEENNINIICLTEHWLNAHQSKCISYDSYVIGSIFTRKAAIHGGSLILLNNNIVFKERKDVLGLSVERCVELSCVELERHIIICVYRPPSSHYETFERVMEEALKRTSCNSKSLIVCGDFNIDLIVPSSISVRFLNLFKSFNLGYLFLEPTRVTDNTATCLDNIFGNFEVRSKKVFDCLGSDHYGQQITFECKEVNTVHTVRCRPLTENRKEYFKQNIKKQLALNEPHNDPNTDFENLFTIINNEFNHSFPVRTFNHNCKTKFCDWATNGIYKSRIRLYDLYATKKYNKDPIFVDYVRNYSKIFKRVCIAAKSLYLSRKINNAPNKIKATWNIINKETGKAKNNDLSFSLEISNNIVNSDSEVAETFQIFFSEIPFKTTRTLDSSAALANTLLVDNVPKPGATFSFNTISADVIIKTFRSINVKKTEDIWGLSVHVLSSIVSMLAPQLANIFNECTARGVFPDLMKVSKIIPLHKNGSKSDPNNFRPISILPSLSKIFEKVILDQLVSYFNQHKLIHNRQFGFTKGSSTTDAAATLIRTIFDAWEVNMNAYGIFCDLSKAFDCVNHDILLGKLMFYGIDNLSIALISSYLSDRTQKVDINRTLSSGATLQMGVPQGSILGPFLFLVYINDLPYLAQGKCDIVLFADDTSLIFKTDRKLNNLNIINDTLSIIHNWFSTNNLALNSNKTKCVKFVLPNVSEMSTPIRLNGMDLEVVNSTIFLGINLDHKLQWHSHIKTLSGKLSAAAYAVRKVRQLTDVETARLVYFSYFHSVMSYGILLWGRAADIESIFVLQKRVVRFIYNLGYRDSLRDVFKDINILTVASQYIFTTIMFVRKNIHLYKRLEEVHQFNTRNKYKLVNLKCRLSKVNKSFVAQGIRFYNKIPSEFLNLPLMQFKSFIKRSLLCKGYYTINEFITDKNAFTSITQDTRLERPQASSAL